MPAPLPPEETRRLEALRRYGVLDTPPEAAFERITALAARLFAVPIALVSLLDADRQWSKSARGVNSCSISRDHAFCSYAILGDDLLVVPDATLDARFVENLQVVGPPHIRFYAGAPLRTAEGYRLGSLCLVDTVPRLAGLDASDRATLTSLAAMVVDALELRLALRRTREVEGEGLRREERSAVHARQQNAVARFGLRALASAESSLDELLTEAADIVAETLGADFSTVFEHLPERGVLVRRAGHGWPKEALGRVEAGSAATRDTPAGYTLATGQPVISADIHQETRFKMSPYAQRQGVVAVADVIIAHVGTGGGPAPAPFGVLSALFRQTHAFSNEDVAFLQAIANTLAAAIARQRAEITTRQARQEAERANAAKSEFLSRMSHELRTPMNAVLGFGQLLEMDDLSLPHRECVAQILTGGRHLLALIDEVLDISRIESGRLDLTMEPVALSEAVGQALKLIKPVAAGRRVSIEDHISAGCCVVLADRQRLKQVLLNLLSNAVKFNHEGGQVILRCAPAAGDPDRVRLSVRDTGPGIAPGMLPRLFVPFERLDAAQRGIEGTGIGLTICQRLVEAMCGVIQVDTAPGHGATFTVELPAARMSLSAPKFLNGSGGPEVVESLPSTRRAVVLHIEDHPAYQALVKQVLAQRANVDLLATMQGQMGLELAREHRPDLILLDLELPDLSGEEVLRRLLGDPQTAGIPVVVLSAETSAGEIVRFLGLGACHYLTKPLEAPALLRAFDDTLPGPVARQVQVVPSRSGAGGGG